MVQARPRAWSRRLQQSKPCLTYPHSKSRRTKKRNFRALWIQRINAGAREHGMSYSQFMGAVHKSGIELNRKVLADLAMNHPDAFKAVCDAVKK